MSQSKIHKILKKYRILHQKHLDSWAKEHIPKIQGVGSKSHENECHNYAAKGNNLFNNFIKELDGLEVFPKKNDKKQNK